MCRGESVRYRCRLCGRITRPHFLRWTRLCRRLRRVADDCPFRKCTKDRIKPDICSACKCKKFSQIVRYLQKHLRPKNLKALPKRIMMKKKKPEVTEAVTAPVDLKGKGKAVDTTQDGYASIWENASENSGYVSESDSGYFPDDESRSVSNHDSGYFSSDKQTNNESVSQTENGESSEGCNSPVAHNPSYIAALNELPPLERVNAHTSRDEQTNDGFVSQTESDESSEDHNSPVAHSAAYIAALNELPPLERVNAHTSSDEQTNDGFVSQTESDESSEDHNSPVAHSAAYIADLNELPPLERVHAHTSSDEQTNDGFVSQTENDESSEDHNSPVAHSASYIADLNELPPLERVNAYTSSDEYPRSLGYKSYDDYMNDMMRVDRVSSDDGSVCSRETSNAYSSESLMPRSASRRKSLVVKAMVHQYLTSYYQGCGRFVIVPLKKGKDRDLGTGFFTELIGLF